MTSAERRSLPPGARVTRWKARDGWELRCLAWPPPAGVPVRGSMLFLGGRGDIFEKYLEAMGHWHARGWTITSFDWRGQGGSGRYETPAPCGHIPNFDLFESDVQDFHAEWAAAVPGPHIVLGHSMGGHLVLRALVERRMTPDAAVLIAPMLGLKSPLGAWAGERLARLLGGVGDSSRPAWEGNERPATSAPREVLLTHDADRYSDELWWHDRHPDLVTGPPSWRWVIEAFRSTRILRNSAALRTTRVPVLALIAEADGLVDPKAAIATVAKLPDARAVRFGPEAAHELLREEDRVRNRAIGEIDLFLAARAQR